MLLKQHDLQQYRNIKELSFRPIEGVNVICGENGQGKTNLLESIFLLTGGKSFRGAKDAALIRTDCDFAAVDSAFFAGDRDQSLSLRITKKGRTAKLNKGTETKASALAGTLCCVVFSPEHLDLVKGNPEGRRRFIDTALCQISSGYIAALRRYTRLLSQKNSLLKDCAYIGAAYDMLDVFDMQIADAATEVTARRRRFCEELLAPAREVYDTISGGREQLSFHYNATLFSEGDTRDNVLLRIRDTRKADIKAGFCTIGPHRDDLHILLNEKDSKIYASQGQQRTIVLSLKLAEATLMETSLGERPILLLDDVLSELDEGRQAFLVDALKNVQAVVTCCAPEGIARRTDAKVFTMRGGELSER